MGSELVKEILKIKGLRVMFYAGVILILAVVVTVFLVAWYFRSRHQVDLQRGSFMRVPSPSAHFVSFSLKKINFIVWLFFILCLFQRSNPPSVTLRGFENRGVVEMGDVSLTDNDDIENVSFF